jgi:hypothetical protein
MNPVPGGIPAPPRSWGIYIRVLGPPGWGNLKNWENMVLSPAGLRWRGTSSNSKLQTCPLVREGATK